MKWFDDVKKYYAFRSLNKRFVMPVWVLVMLDNGLSVEHIALIAGVCAIASFLLEVPSGSIADTIGHKQALLLSMIGQGTGLMLFIGGTFWWFLAGSLMYWGIGTLMSGTHQAMFYERLVELNRVDEYRKLSGRSRSISSFWSMATVAFAGVMYAWNPTVTFLIGGLLFWIGGAVVSTMHEPKQKKSVKKEEGFWQLITHFTTAFATIKKNKKLLWLMVTSSTALGVAWAAGEFQQIILENIGLATALFGVFYALKRFFTATTALFLHRLFEGVSPPMTATIMTILVTCYYLLVGTTTNHLAMAGVILLISACFVIQSIVVNDQMNKLIPSGSRATTLSMSNFIQNTAKILIIGGIGLLSSLITIEGVHILLGFILIIVFLIMIPMTFRAYRP